MRDNDIRKIFDSAMEENTNTEINAEKIQDTVMERLGKRQGSNISFYEAEDMENRVEPIYVTSPAKRSHKWAAAAVSAAAAACLAITAVSTNFFGIGNNLTAMTGDEADTSDQSDIPETEGESETQEETEAETDTPEAAEKPDEKSEATTYDLVFIQDPPEVPYGSMEEYMGNRLSVKNSNFTFLDGLEIRITDETVGTSDDTSKRNWLLSEEEGRVYFWNGKEKKDVTDLITIESPYVETYVNEGSGLTHYIIIGGDVGAGKYGYAEGFATYDSNRIWLFDTVCSRNTEEVKKIMRYVIQVAIKNETGEQHLSMTNSFTGVDFKSNILVCDR